MNIATQVSRACIKAVRHHVLSLIFTDDLKGVTLNGFNLDIAVAASKAGFDTHNHSCLFDLIWAVKRIALRASKGAVVDRPPPRDPVYPDRFRPSGIGDNTKRKRPPPQFAPPQATPVKLETIIKPAQTNQRQFRYRNKKAPSRAKQVPVSKLSGYSTRGTQENPVELLSDSDEPVGVKRQKLNAAAFSKPRPSANTSQARAAPERLLGDGDMLTPQPEIVTQDTMQVDGHTYVRTSAQYNDDLDGGQLHLLQVDLQKVKDELKATVSNLKWCNDSMSTAFETYRDVMARRDVHSSLGRLSENFETARTSALQGIGHLNDILDILG